MSRMSERPCTDPPDTALLDMYSCVVDYACRYRHLDVIYEVSQHMNKNLSTLTVPHLRLASASLYKMVVCDDVSEFYTALQLAQCLFEAAGSFSNGTLVRCYAKLVCGLKVKALFHCLPSSPKEAFTLLRKYFPRGGDTWDKQLSLHNATLAEEIRKVSQDFRKCFLHLIGHKHRRESFMSREYQKVYNHRFSRCLVRRAASFLTELERGLPDTFLDELLKGNWKEHQTVNTPTLWDVLMELLLDCVEGKTTLQSADLLSLLNDLHSCSMPNQLDIRRGVKRIRLLSSSDGQSVSSGSQGSQHSSGTPPGASSTIPYTVEGRHHKGMHTVSEETVNDNQTSHFSDKTTTSPTTQSNTRSCRTCEGCKQSKRIRLSAVHPHKYCGQRGTYIPPACHVKLLYQKTYQDLSGDQHPLFI